MPLPTRKEYEGRTEDAEAPFLNAEFWQIGRIIRGVVYRTKETEIEGKKSPAIELDLETPVEIEGEEWERVSVGNLSGIRMALQNYRPNVIKSKDFLELECVSIKKAKKEGFSDRINFRVKVIPGT